MKGSIWKNPAIFLVITLVSIAIGRTVEYLVHEAGHYLAARFLGVSFPADPIHLVLSTPFFVKLYPNGVPGFSESLVYDQIIAAAGNSAGLLAIGGVTMNALAAILCFWLFMKTQVIRYKFVISVVLWILVCNLGALYSYIPLRVFSSTGDVGIFLSSFWIHPVIFLFPAIILIIVGLILYFTTILPIYSVSIPVKSLVLRFFILFCSTILILMYMTGPFIAGFNLSDLMNLPEVTNVFPIILIGQIFLLIVVIILGLLRLMEKDGARYLDTKKSNK